MPRTVLTPPGEKLFVPDSLNWSWQEYGMRVGFWRIKAAFDRLGIKPTFSLNASVCDVYPRIAEAALEAGWEFLPHTYYQGPMHLLEDERQTIKDTIERIERLRPIADRLGCTMAQLALAWCATNPAVSTVITGASRVEQVEQNFGTVEVIPAVDASVRAEIGAVFDA